MTRTKNRKNSMDGFMSRVYQRQSILDDVNNWSVYRIFVPQHRYDQGYIGVSQLSQSALEMRYIIECYEAENKDYARRERRVHKMLRKFANTWQVEMIYTHLTREAAFSIEERLRPNDNPVSKRDPYNWNTIKGGDYVRY